MSERLIAQHLHLRRHGLAEFGWAPTDTDAVPLPEEPVSIPAEAGISKADQDFWEPPSPSTASRRPPARSRGHCSGSLVDPRSNRELVFESNLERNIALVALADHRIQRIWDQPPAVQYLDEAGRIRRHTFDFLFEVVGGARIAIAVKPSAKVERSGISRTLDLIRRQAPPGFADHYALRTERHATPAMVQNAELVLRARRMRNPDHVEAAARVAATLTRPETMAAFAMRCRLGTGGWNAVVSLIDDGRLELVDPTAMINDLALVRPTPALIQELEIEYA